MQPKLTIGMATYDDFDGAWFTLQSLRLHHDLSQVELIVVDNKPDASGSPDLKRKIEGWMQHGTAGARYIAAPETVGTSAPRDRVFREAAGDAVLCVDSHVLLAPGAISRLLAWYEAHSDRQDLLQGPLLLDHLAGVHTHFLDVWRSEMWGIWGSAWEVCPGGDRVSVIDEGGRARFIALEMGHVPLSSSASCGKPLPDVPYAGHERALIELGLRPLGLDPQDEFEIPGQGLGLFSCRKAAWPGFHPQFRGFGGEEMYLHEKFRQLGRRCLCLGFLKWVHRFARPGGVKYPLTRWNKVRNYVLGHQELGLPLDRVHEHFVGGRLLSESHWQHLIADPVGHLHEPSPAPPQSIEEIYHAVRPPLARTRDLDEHMPRLAELAAECRRITEFTHRRESLIAFAWGQSTASRKISESEQASRGSEATIVSYNLEATDPLVQRVRELMSSTRLERLDSPDVAEIAETDLLFLDTRHTRTRLSEELAKFAGSVRRFIVLHDTQLHGTRGEDGGDGLLAAVQAFLASDLGDDWFIASHSPHQYGLTVLARLPEDRPAQPILLWPPGHGPGTELKRILKSLGIEPSPSCDCRARADQMDMWGVAGCRDNRTQVITWLRDGHARWGWKDKLAAAARAVQNGLAFKLNPLDPFPSLVDEAVQRAEVAVGD